VAATPKLLLSQPKQARAKQALERILTVAVRVIERDGVASLTTEEIARRADVNIATVYKYFRNKDAIIHYLALRMADGQTQHLAACIASFDPKTSWRVVLPALVKTMVESWTSIPGFRQIQSYFVLDPALHASYRDTSRDVARLLEKFKTSWEFTGTKREWERIHVVFGECATALLDLALEAEGREQKKVIDELIKIALTYHALYFK
jgi:AcrR family transcriptional regulator